MSQIAALFRQGLLPKALLAVIRCVAVFAVASLGVACGYTALYGERGLYGSGGLYGGARFCVTGASPLVADTAVVAEVEAGVRRGLARAGVLRAGGGYPRVVVEVLRLDESSEGIAAVPGGTRVAPALGLPISPATPRSPLARGTLVGVWARAWIEWSPEGARERETGDMRTSDLRGAESSAQLEALRQDDAARAGARRLGERLARRILGEPETSDEGN